MLITSAETIFRDNGENNVIQGKNHFKEYYLKRKPRQVRKCSWGGRVVKCLLVENPASDSQPPWLPLQSLDASPVPGFRCRVSLPTPRSDLKVSISQQGGAASQTMSSRTRWEVSQITNTLELIQASCLDASDLILRSWFCKPTTKTKWNSMIASVAQSFENEAAKQSSGLEWYMKNLMGEK